MRVLLCINHKQVESLSAKVPAFFACLLHAPLCFVFFDIVKVAFGFIKWGGEFAACMNAWRFHLVIWLLSSEYSRKVPTIYKWLLGCGMHLTPETGRLLLFLIQLYFSEVILLTSTVVLLLICNSIWWTNYKWPQYAYCCILLFACALFFLVYFLECWVFDSYFVSSCLEEILATFNTFTWHIFYNKYHKGELVPVSLFASIFPIFP